VATRRVTQIQELRRSNAAGPHRDRVRGRRVRDRDAIQESLAVWED
jgi:hypothetical protein